MQAVSLLPLGKMEGIKETWNEILGSFIMFCFYGVAVFNGFMWLINPCFQGQLFYWEIRITQMGVVASHLIENNDHLWVYIMWVNIYWIQVWRIFCTLHRKSLVKSHYDLVTRDSNFFHTQLWFLASDGDFRQFECDLWCFCEVITGKNIVE